ncbi:unnamed protein product, partial [Prunus brigantina]
LIIKYNIKQNNKYWESKQTQPQKEGNLSTFLVQPSQFITQATQAIFFFGDSPLLQQSWKINHPPTRPVPFFEENLAGILVLYNWKCQVEENMLKIQVHVMILCFD